ncbi:hypothetical protein AB0M36_29160 [Actinoplanes sp. NPDC051346]|uniref:hypothetical protein n=1 Tax=Actinoplanes sp. NPDC051346 TaxID=3155048 RepID=UPI0034221745
MKVRVKILVTAVAGGLTYLLTNATNQPEIWQLTMSVFVGGIVLVTQVLIEYDLAVIDLKATMTEHSQRTEDVVDRRFAQVSEATALYGRVEATALREDQITRLVCSAASIRADDHLLRRFADYEINRLARLFDGLESGWAFYEGEDRDWLLDLTACVEETIDATSMTSFDTPKGFVDEGQFWASDLGQRYLAQQRRAINDRGVRVRRLFVLDDASAEDAARIETLVSPHRKIGVETRVLRQSKLDFLLQPDLFDFILFDGRLSYELRSASVLGPEARPLIASVTLVVDWRVEDRKQRFEQLWRDADER